MSGNFPFNIWNGGLNNVFDKGATYKDFLFYFNNNKDLPIRFNFSNILADDLDFTDAMTNKMAKVLQYLADQISQSAKTINKADEIQKKRHEHIQKLINEMRELMNMGLDITIKEANSESYTPSASSGSASGNYSGGSSYSDNYEVSKSPGKENASTRNSGGIDYNRLRETIKSAILATKPISPKR